MISSGVYDFNAATLRRFFWVHVSFCKGGFQCADVLEDVNSGIERICGSVGWCIDLEKGVSGAES